MGLLFLNEEVCGITSEEQFGEITVGPPPAEEEEINKLKSPSLWLPEIYRNFSHSISSSPSLSPKKGWRKGKSGAFSQICFILTIFIKPSG